MTLLRISANVAANIDKQLMGTLGFSIDQLMELAGLAVADAVYALKPPGPSILVLSGPGNNGGDGLVASRHLSLLGFKPVIYYPKPSKGPLYDNLQTQLHAYQLPIIQSESELTEAFSKADFIVDALFGFSFKPPVRESFVPVMTLLAATKKPVLAVDIPSSWSVNDGPSPDFDYQPSSLISLTAPKKSADHFHGRHFIGGRFITPQFAKDFGFEVPPYEGTSQIYEE